MFDGVFDFLGGKMSFSRLSSLKLRYEKYCNAELAILDGAQSYQIGSRNLTRADLSEVTDMIKYLEKEIAAEESKAKGTGRNRVMGIVPRDV